jgi:hypothetical protein
MSNQDRTRLLGRIGAHQLHATHDSRELTQQARTAFLARFEREVDPRSELAPEERHRRARHARRVYFLRLALRSADIRRQRRDEKTGGEG